MQRFIAILMIVLLAVLTSAATGASKIREHTVARGNTLGKIAKRYQITVDALCHGNDIEEQSPIRVGQTLLIPPKDDDGGKRTRKELERRRAAEKNENRSGKDKKKRSSSKSKRKKKASSSAGSPKWHRVYKGQHLGMIAKRYNTSVKAIVHANDIQKKEPIHPGQMLIIPAPDDEDGSATRKVYEAREGEPPVEVEEKSDDDEKKSWKKYARKPKKKGYVHIVGLSGHSYKGYLVNHKRLVVSKAKEEMRKVLATKAGEEHDIDLTLLRRIADVSDTFGGRTIKVVSGYRTGKGTSATSRHRHGKAVDITIAGVPNTALRDFAKTFDNVGVGYYPNSSFVHIDTRTQWTYWIDYSGPGQRPRYGGFWTRR